MFVPHSFYVDDGNAIAIVRDSAASMHLIGNPNLFIGLSRVVAVLYPPTPFCETCCSLLHDEPKCMGNPARCFSSPVSTRAKSVDQWASTGWTARSTQHTIIELDTQQSLACARLSWRSPWPRWTLRCECDRLTLLAHPISRRNSLSLVSVRNQTQNVHTNIRRVHTCSAF